MKPVIGITMGDAAGIGPEIIAKALSRQDIYDDCDPIVIGDARVMKRAVAASGLELEIREVENIRNAGFRRGVIDCVDLGLLSDDIVPGQIDARCGDASFRFVSRAVELAINREIDAICTAPLNKAALHLGGHPFPGHTEILAELTGTKDFSMMLSTPQLKVIHLTTHVGLKKAIDLINPERTYNVIRLAHDMFVQAGREQPSIAVCGINPHAGENGLFGEGEEEEKLVPAIRIAEKEGIHVSGPYPADTLFYRAARGDFDIVVACYHDQGHAPIKVLGIEEGVNITVGLKGGIVRTSVDHGTAYDIAWQDMADERSMIAAIRAAVELAPQGE